MTKQIYKIPYDNEKKEFLYQDDDFRTEYTSDILKAIVNETSEGCLDWKDIQNKNVVIRTYEFVCNGSDFEINMLKEEFPNQRIKYVVCCGEFSYAIPIITRTSYGFHRVFRVMGDTYFAEDVDEEQLKNILNGVSKNLGRKK